jgi:pyruvate formate lyase activating enzyme
MQNYKPTQYWHAINNNKVQCDLCPRYCQLSEGQRGFCFIRLNMNNQVILSSYGRSSGFAIDPIEKKPLNHFYPGSNILSFGTAGCNLNCKFCQNWDMSKSREMDRLSSTASPQQIALYAQQNQCKSVAYTYNDPIIFHEYAYDTALACKEKNINSVAVTAGYICAKPREEFFSVMDATNIDLKAFSEDFYLKMTGSHLQQVLETLEYVYHKTTVWLEITTLLIPGLNDSEAELHKMSEWIVEHLGFDIPLHFSAFSPQYKLQSISATPLTTLLKAREIAMSKGLNYVYCGNVHDAQSDSTWCSNCGNLLIERDWYQLGKIAMDEKGICHHCGERCSGIF